jgi:acyl-[acyl carrier protein]--UDP-N-acetylglucosamine O-acyltransferase
LITPMPYALWSTKSTNLDVANNLTVGGTANVTGSLRVDQDATVGTNLTVTSHTDTGSLTVAQGATVGETIQLNTNAADPNERTTIRGMKWSIHDATATCNLNPVQAVTTMTPMATSACFITNYADFDSDSAHIASCVESNDGTNWTLISTCAAVGGEWYCQAKCLEWDW